MRGLINVFIALAVISVAFWAYHENYKTKSLTSETERLQHEIGKARERLAMLRAEWAYLNRPDRLRDLAEINFDSLGLLPLRPDQFGSIDQVGFPPPELDLSGAIEVSSMEAPE